MSEQTVIIKLADYHKYRSDLNQFKAENKALKGELKTFLADYKGLISIEKYNQLKKSRDELLKALQYCCKGVNFNFSSEILELIQEALKDKKP